MLLLLLNYVVLRALLKIDVYLISTLVNKSLYYYYYNWHCTMGNISVYYGGITMYFYLMLIQVYVVRRYIDGHTYSSQAYIQCLSIIEDQRHS